MNWRVETDFPSKNLDYICYVIYEDECQLRVVRFIDNEWYINGHESLLWLSDIDRPSKSQQEAAIKSSIEYYKD